MGYSNLRFQIIVRISAIALTLFLLFELVSSDAFALTVLLVLTLVVVQVIALIKFIDKTNQDIIDFLRPSKTTISPFRRKTMGMMPIATTSTSNLNGNQKAQKIQTP